MRRGGVLGPTNSAYIIIITIIVINIIVIVIVINIAIIIILIILTRSHQFYQWINLTLIMQVSNISDREKSSIIFSSKEMILSSLGE